MTMHRKTETQERPVKSDSKLSRRRFASWCGAVAALLLGRTAQASEKALQPFAKVALVDQKGRGIKSHKLEPEREYVFFYPYVSTPCFLLRLTQPAESQQLHTATGETYTWPGGVGDDHSVVAFVAICSHKLTHPSEPVSFIGYRQQPVGFLGRQNKVVQRAAVIQCCSEHSIYDPMQGCRVLAGPAPQPLGAIVLEERTEGLYATGVYGGLLYDRFFERFGFRLELEFANKARQLVTNQAQVMAIEDYTRQRIQC